MIDPRIIKLLDSRDVEQRKKAVTALARSKDPEALRYLAKVYKEDRDQEVRELARKGGLYIRKNSGTASVTSADSRLYEDDDDDEDRYSGARDTYAASPVYYEDDDEAEVDNTPLPSEIHVSEMDQVKAQGFVNQAIDWNIRGNNEKAAQYLERALKANPRLMHDGYTITLAATITGIDGHDAVKQLGPDTDELRKRSKGEAGHRSTALEGLLAYIVLVGAVLVLVSYFLFPWIDLSGIETVDGFTGQTTTLGESLNSAKEQFNALMALAGGQANSPEITRIRDALNGLKISLTGLDTTLVSIGASNIFDVMGLTDFINLISGVMGASLGLGQGDMNAAMNQMLADMPDPTPLDYTLPLVPVTAVVAILLAITLLQRMSVSRWVLTILTGLLGLVPIIYFYINAGQSIVPEDFELSTFGDMTVPNATDLIGLGYWVSLVGMLIVALLPFVAMLVMPSPEKSDAR